MKKKIIIWLTLCVMCIGCLAGCNEEPVVQQPQSLEIINAFATRNDALYKFKLDGEPFVISRNLPNSLVECEYINDLDDISLLVKLGYNSGEAQAVYYKMDSTKACCVLCQEIDGYMVVELRFKMVDGQFKEYKFNSITENSSFQWLGFPLSECTADKLVVAIGEPTSMEKEDNGMISALIYKGTGNEYLRIDFLGGKLWGIKMYHKI